MITESQVIDWLLSQHIALRNISRTDYSAITLTSNGYEPENIKCSIALYDGKNHAAATDMQTALSDLDAACNSRIAKINEQLAALQAEKEQLEAVKFSKSISDKMQEVAV